MRTFEVNGKKYNAKPFDFNMVCDFEDMGVRLRSGGIATVRAYFAVCGNMGLEEAGLELNSHVVNGGNFDEIKDVMCAEMEESDFFQILVKGAAEKNTESKKETK